ncbi:hypothetical protein [Paenibacillus sp. NRS-1760]|uniref:hypothetical protein n=1 Tax=Paenibacillus sp. NRS-1760 TaxID=3233902 RepID=UPI003D2B88E0
MSEYNKFMLRLVDNRLVIDLNNADVLAFKAKGFTGLPEQFEMDIFFHAPVIGTVELSEEQQILIAAAYENGGKCAWCDEVSLKLRLCHIFDSDSNGGKMCQHCWDHDREVYKGSYGEDIGPFDNVLIHK